MFENKEKILNELIASAYEMKYLSECQYIWNNYVPNEGQSTVLQGELLRAIEKLRYEAQDNGDINWDDDFVFFCDFLKETLCAQKIYKREEKKKASIILDYFKACGEYAVRFANGEISDKDFDIAKMPYVNDNLYDIIADAIGYFQKCNSEPIPYTGNIKLKR